MSQRLLGLDPDEVGGAAAKASFAKALTERCLDGDRIDALVDVILVPRAGRRPARPRRSRASSAARRSRPATRSGHFLGLAQARRERARRSCTSRAATARTASSRSCAARPCRDKRAVQRFLTANRLVAERRRTPGCRAASTPAKSTARYWVSYVHVDAQPLSARLARTRAVAHQRRQAAPARHPRAARRAARGAHRPRRPEARERPRRAEARDGRPRTSRSSTSAPTACASGPPSRNGHTGVSPSSARPRPSRPSRCAAVAPTRRRDVYAFGAMMYELLSGKPVFPSESATDAAFAHVIAGARAAERQGAPRVDHHATSTSSCSRSSPRIPSAGPRTPPRCSTRSSRSVARSLCDAGGAGHVPGGAARHARRPARRRARRRRRGDRAREGHRGGRRPHQGRRGVRGRGRGRRATAKTPTRSR